MKKMKMTMTKCKFYFLKSKYIFQKNNNKMKKSFLLFIIKWQSM